MPEKVIEIEQLSKWYRLGSISTGSFRQDLKRWWVKDILKKKDPFFDPLNAVEEVNSIWAIKDLNLTINEGEIWGFVGSNGAGKSTLLKIISKIVKPTKGVVRGRGTISSLLEVGTGFHEELSGRENIYICGYLLGMKKSDIRKNFDAIVDFSELHAFIDTPVKRYSSGMYVKLAFAIAAHLEPDILIVDEVLAVGDAAFQKKCLGKMNEVSKEKGRTILFVSHNMQAVKQLCTKALWLHKGKGLAEGEATKIIQQYINNVQKTQLGQYWSNEDAPGNELVKLFSVELDPQFLDESDTIDIRTPLKISIGFSNEIEGQKLQVGISLFSYNGECVFELVSPVQSMRKGKREAQSLIPGYFLNDGSYYFSVSIIKDEMKVIFNKEECVSFEVSDYRAGASWYSKWTGVVRPHFPVVLNESFSEGDSPK